MSGLATQYNAVNLGQGFPDFQMSEELIALVNEAMLKGYNQYPPMPGWLPLREAIAEKTNYLYNADINPDTEIIIYVYSPVPTEGSELYEKVSAAGFKFPQKLEDWLSSDWESFDLRKNPLTPWLKPFMVDKIKNFETVLNAYYPTASDFKLTGFQKKTMRILSALRY